jgi:hypothetical protein
VSFWNPLSNWFGRSNPRGSGSRAAAKHRHRRNRRFEARIEQLEHRALLTSVTGDFNGDHIADLAIGIPTQTVNGATNAGSVQILYGAPPNGQPYGITAVGNQLWTRSSIGSTPTTNDRFGAALAVGDFNRDGIADLVVGAPGQSGVGVVYVFLGSKLGLRSGGVQLITQGILDRISQSGNNFGSALAVGDFNNDHFADLAIGTPNRMVNGLTNVGAVNIVYGRPLGLRAINNQQFDQTQLGATAGAAAGNLFGSALAASDFNANGFRDLAIGAPGQNNNAGSVDVLYGRLLGLKTANSQVWKVGSNGIQGTSNDNAQFGFSLAAGDFNDDSRSDLAIGAPAEDIPAVGSQPAVSLAGAVHILFGSSGRLTSTNNQLWHENIAGIANTAAAAGDQFGAALAIGRMNGDRFDDLAIGIPGQAITPQGGGSAASAAGSVRVLYSAGSSGLGTTNTALFSQDTSGIIGDGVVDNERFGESVAIGDFNGDRISDLAIEVPGEDDNKASQGGEPIAGSANIIYGSNSGLTVGGATGFQASQFWLPRLGIVVEDPNLAAKNLRDGNAFLAANKNKPGINVLPSGVQYKILSSGSGGASPTNSSSVTVNYIGTLIDGTKFDASADHGGPQTFDVSGVVAGFADALKHMKVGDHWQIFIPAALGYGNSNFPRNIGPNQVLIFDLELLSFTG